MTIILRLSFVIDETSCETALKRTIIYRLCSLIYVIIVCQFSCVDEIMRKIIEYCVKTRATAKTKATAKTTTTTKITARKHITDFDVDRDVDFDDVDFKNEILF
jgi:hypothetical protein